MFSAPLPVRVWKAQTSQDSSHLRLNGVPIARAKFTVELVKTIGDLRIFGARRIDLSHLASELFHLLLHLLERSEHRHAFGEDTAAGEREAILRQIAGAGAASDAEAAVFERLNARQNLEQSGFAGAIGAHQASAIFRSDQPVQVLKQQLVAEALASAGKLDHREKTFLVSSFSCLVRNVERPSQINQKPETRNQKRFSRRSQLT